MTFLRDIVMSGRIRLDPSRNDFPVTLHDPCNMVRLMGVVEPQPRDCTQDLSPVFAKWSRTASTITAAAAAADSHHERE